MANVTKHGKIKGSTKMKMVPGEPIEINLNINLAISLKLDENGQIMGVSMAPAKNDPPKEKGITWSQDDDNYKAIPDFSGGDFVEFGRDINDDQ